MYKEGDFIQFSRSGTIARVESISSNGEIGVSFESKETLFLDIPSLSRQTIKICPSEDIIAKFNAIKEDVRKLAEQAKHDEEIRQREVEQIKKDSIIETHKNWMAQQGMMYSGVRAATSFHRSSHCYACQNPVDNAYDLECAVCGWIICNNNTCGACGCGYIGHMQSMLNHQLRHISVVCEEDLQSRRLNENFDSMFQPVIVNYSD